MSHYDDVIVRMHYMNTEMMKKPDMIDQASAVCGGNLTSSSGNITSPGYPEDYENNLSCDWDISCPVDKKILVTFTDIDVEHYGSSCYDTIQIFEGTQSSVSQTYELCKEVDAITDDVFTFVSTSQFVRIRFTSDESVSKRGFKANYSFIERDCVYDVDDESGIITSPNYPGKYPANVQCVYKFTFRPDQRLTLSFLSFDLEKEGKDGSCSDFVRLRDADFRMLGQFCGDTVPRSYSFYRGDARMLFFTDRSKNGDGFRLAYQVYNVTECLEDSRGLSYTGQANVTANGSACARWDSEIAMKNGFISLLDQENYCRNPNNGAMPWCFSTDTLSPEYCNISVCEMTTPLSKTTVRTTTTTFPTTSTSSSMTTFTTQSTVTTSNPYTTTMTVSTSSPLSVTSTTIEESTKTSNPIALSSTTMPTDLLILFIVVPILLLIIIFGIAIALVRFIVKKKKMNLPISQLRSIVNPNYVSKDSVTDGYMGSYENDVISRQSIVAARESVFRMSRKNSRSQMESIYYSAEDITISTLDRKKRTKGSKKDESPYIESNDTYDLLGQRRMKKVDPNEYRTYSEVSAISESQEIYDHMKTSSRVLDNTPVSDEGQAIYGNTEMSSRIQDDTSVVQESQENDEGKVRKSRITEEVPVYATVDKRRKSSMINRRPQLPEPIDINKIRASIGVKSEKSTDSVDNSKSRDSVDNTIATTSPSAPQIEEETYYKESDITYDQLRRQRTRRNKNLGVKVSIYSEIMVNNLDDEVIYNSTESADRIKEEESTDDNFTRNSPSDGQSSELATNEDADLNDNKESTETDDYDIYIESSKL
ncbi:uncharacterized protein LOC133196695 [Saccostrea echinata]|uniref:uncharacterized protein LOC133196695 n=1 Tax=Saccostrea echinata TaxID=191078 RepID=UPI002A827227|nr:uncharacterized protein LOC133196695 [Saccostrea echinata]